MSKKKIHACLHRKNNECKVKAKLMYAYSKPYRITFRHHELGLWLRAEEQARRLHQGCVLRGMDRQQNIRHRPFKEELKDCLTRWCNFAPVAITKLRPFMYIMLYTYIYVLLNLSTNDELVLYISTRTKVLCRLRIRVRIWFWVLQYEILDLEKVLICLEG